MSTPRKKREELIHVDDLIFTGDSKYINEIFLPKIQGKFDTSASQIERIGDELIHFSEEKVQTGS